MNTATKDKKLIQALGGAAQVAKILGFSKAGGVQRVHNWQTRGIPAAIKLGRPDLFLKHLVKGVSK